MILKRDWLWDRKISIPQAKAILRNPQNKHYLNLSGVLLSRKNSPKKVFNYYLKPLDFLQSWHRIKRQMRKDSWNNPRIEFWQAIYEKLKEKYKSKNLEFTKQAYPVKPRYELCKLIADKIKAVRKQSGITQSGLAKKLKVSQQMISRIEKGRENISLLTLKNIANGLGCELHLDILKKDRRSTAV